MPILIVGGKVTRGSHSSLEQGKITGLTRTFPNMFLQQNIPVRCYYPQARAKSSLSSTSKHIIVQGAVLRTKHEHCILFIGDIVLGPGYNIVAGPTSDLIRSVYLRQRQKKEIVSISCTSACVCNERNFTRNHKLVYVLHIFYQWTMKILTWNNNLA